MASSPTSLLDALHIDQLTAEEQDELLSDVSELIFKGTLVRLIEHMDEPTRLEFDTLLKSDAPEEVVESFIEKHIPDSSKAVEEAISELTDDILAVTKE